MKEFYYQIKGKKSEKDKESYGMYGDSNWVFPPLWSDKIEAEDKKEAKRLTEEEYGKKFPLRVLKKDLDSNEFLISIKEIKDDDHHLKRLFEVNTCKYCEREFKIIEKYQIDDPYKGSEYCSYDCKTVAYQLEKIKRNEHFTLNQSLFDKNKRPVIYKITNKKTNKSYIGKTTQVFTLRWYQHFFCSTGTKFHEEIKNSDLTEWTFEIIEVVNIPEEVKNINEIDKIIIERERHWINEHNTLNEGYNTI